MHRQKGGRGSAWAKTKRDCQGFCTCIISHLNQVEREPVELDETTENQDTGLKRHTASKSECHEPLDLHIQKTIHACCTDQGEGKDDILSKHKSHFLITDHVFLPPSVHTSFPIKSLESPIPVPPSLCPQSSNFWLREQRRLKIMLL